MLMKPWASLKQSIRTPAGQQSTTSRNLPWMSVLAGIIPMSTRIQGLLEITDPRLEKPAMHVPIDKNVEV